MRKSSLSELSITYSVKQYIFSGLDGVKHTSFTFEEVQGTIADTVVTYLNYGVFGTELSTVKVRPIVAQSAPSKIVQATMGTSSGTARQLAIRYLEPRRQYDFDMSKVVAEVRSLLKSKPKHTFKFYTYAHTYWQEHVLYASGHNDSIFKLSSKPIYHRSSELIKVDKNYWTRFKMVAECRSERILAIGLLLQTRKIDSRQRDDTEMAPLMCAAVRGHKGIVEVLLSVGKSDVEAKDLWGRTALMSAAYSGHKDVVEVLLSFSKSSIEAQDLK